MSSELLEPVVPLILMSVLCFSLPYLSHSFISYSLLSPSQALEKRVAELEEENGNLRAALNLPPANRPPLGKGPTGKDKAKRLSARPPRVSTDLKSVSRAGSSDDSPTSTRAQSLSPSTITASMLPPSNARNSRESGPWDQSMLMDDQRIQQAPHPSPPSTGYHLPGLRPHSKAPSQFTYPSPAHSTRTNLPGTMYLPVASKGPKHFGHPSDCPLTAAYGRNYPVRDIGEDQQRFPRSQPYSVLEAALPSQHLPSTQGLHYPTQKHRDPPSTQEPIPSTRNRTISDPQEFSLIPSMERLSC